MADYKKALQFAVKSQWKAVVKDYPLVAAAVIMGKKELAPVIRKEIAVSAEIPELLNGQLDMATATKVGVRVANCFQKFETALARSQRSEDVKSATTGLSDCLGRRKT